MPVINVKRFSRSKVDAPASPSVVVDEPKNTFEAPAAAAEVEYEAPAAGDDDAEDFSDLTRSAFENQQREAAASETRAASEKERAKEDAKIEKEMAKKVAELEKRAAKQQKKAPAAAPKRSAAAVDDDSVFGEQGSEILGRDKRQLITKITQYRQLFPKELKGFKVKKNASTQELRAYLDEMACIVEVGTLDEFITDSILMTLKMVEGLSSYTKNCNISGLADMLRMNPQFNSLVKQLYIKYNTFDNVPPEQQLIILVITTSYVCIQKNKNKSKIESFLNEPVSFPAEKNGI